MDNNKALKEIHKRRRVEAFLRNAIYREATSARYKQHPHSYTLRANGYKYWTMGYGLDQTKLINKAKLK